jgi:predicted transposase/invertase (TIGR01784 family)
MAELTNPHDVFFKSIFSDHEAAADFLRYYVPADIASSFDYASLQIIKDSFVDQELREHFSDILYQIHLQDGGNVFVYILFEHKSYPDPLISYQLLRYMVRVWELAQRQGEQLELIFSIVVYHGEAEWRVGRNLHDLIGVPAPFKNYVPDFQYFLCDLSEYDEAEIKGAILLRIGLLALKYIFHEDLIQHLPGILTLFHQISVRDRALECLEIFLRYLFGAGNKRINKQDLKRVITTTLPEGGVVMSTIAQELIEEGKKQGIQQGRRQGILDAIETDLEFAFGEEGLKEMEEINKIEDIDKLYQIHRALKTAKTIGELRRIYQ